MATVYRRLLTVARSCDGFPPLLYFCIVHDLAAVALEARSYF